MKKYRPMTYNWFDPPIKRKKDMTFPEAQMKFGLKPFGDTDKDGKPNWRDCRPYDPFRQGIIEEEESAELPEIASSVKGKVIKVKDDISEKIDDWQEERKQKKEKKKTLKIDEKKYKKTLKEGELGDISALPYYLIVKHKVGKDTKWQIFGPFTSEEIGKESQSATVNYGVGNVVKTQNPEDLKILQKQATVNKYPGLSISKYRPEDKTPSGEDVFKTGTQAFKESFTGDKYFKGKLEGLGKRALALRDESDMREAMRKYSGGSSAPPKSKNLFRIEHEPPLPAFKEPIVIADTAYEPPEITRQPGIPSESDEVAEEQNVRFMDRSPPVKRQRRVYRTYGQSNVATRVYRPFQPVESEVRIAQQPATRDFWDKETRTLTPHARTPEVRKHEIYMPQVRIPRTGFPSITFPKIRLSPSKIETKRPLFNDEKERLL
jgi:hypothetical protein